LFLAVSVPVAMLTRCVVVAGAAVVKQSAREKKQAQFARSEGMRPRLKNEFMHITPAGAIIHVVRRLPGRMNPRAPKSFPQFFRRNRTARAVVQRERDGYAFECVVRDADVGTLAAARVAPR